jgi:hypothetical protein
MPSWPCGLSPDIHLLHDLGRGVELDDLAGASMQRLPRPSMTAAAMSSKRETGCR